MNAARRCLKESNDAMVNHNYHNVCNRAYYAVFNAAHAALAKKGVSAPKKHAGLIHQFNFHIRHAGLFDTDISKFLSRTQDNRHSADYVSDGIDKDTAIESLSMATDFVSEVSTRLRQIGRARNRE